MHYTKIFTLAGVFLAVALVTPPIAFYFEGNRELDIYSQDLPAHQTSGNASYLDQIRLSRQNTFIVIAFVESVFVVLFVVTMYYGINHIHPSHQRIGLRDKDTPE